MHENTQKKLVFVHPAIRPYRRELFEILAKKYASQFIFVEDYQDNLNQLKRADNIGPWKAYTSGAFLFYSKGVTLSLLKDILFGDYDVWVGSGLFHFSTHLAVFLVWLKGKKFVLFSEDWWVSKRIKNQVFLPFARLVARMADAVVVASGKSREFFLELGVKKERLFLGWNATIDYGALPADTAILSGLQKEYKAQNEFLVLYFGRIVEYKGLDVLISAFAKLKNRNNIRLLVAGEGGYLENCKALAKRLGLSNVFFAGRVENIQAQYYYRLADLFVLPARFMPKDNVVAEAWGFTVNEALSCGLPVLTTTAVAAGEILSEGKNGFVVEAGQAEPLREKIDWCFENREQVKQMGEAAKNVRQRVNPENQAEAFEKAIKFAVYGRN